jgi:hypothetical protein
MRQYSPPGKMVQIGHRNFGGIAPVEIEDLDVQDEQDYGSKDFRIKEPSVFMEHEKDEMTEQEEKIVELFRRRRIFTLKA